VFAVFIQGPGSSLRFLAIRPTRDHAEGALRAFADRLAQDDPHRDVNAFVVPCDYFYLHGGQMDRAGGADPDHDGWARTHLPALTPGCRGFGNQPVTTRWSPTESTIRLSGSLVRR
jgi:hypothetical protein